MGCLKHEKIAFRPCVARVCGVSIDSGLFWAKCSKMLFLRFILDFFDHILA